MTQAPLSGKHPLARFIFVAFLTAVLMFAIGAPALAAIFTVEQSSQPPVFSTLIPDQAYVVKDNVNYKLYYAGNDFASINLATSPDGLTWTPYAGNPILAEGPSVQAEHADVHFYGAGFAGGNSGTNPSALTMYYRMWYQAADGHSIASWRYAESPNGIAWYNRVAVTQFGPPVFSAATGVAYGIADVVYTPGGEGGDPNKTFRIYANVQWEVGVYSAREVVVMAYSANGHDWTGYDPLLVGYATPIFGGTLNAGDFDSDHIGWFKVIKNSAADWEAFYSGGTATTFQALNGIGYATSTDGISWARKQTLLTTADPVAWRSQSVWMPSVVKTGSDYEMFFLGSDNPDIGSSDWIQWKLGRAGLISNKPVNTLPANGTTGSILNPTLTASNVPPTATGVEWQVDDNPDFSSPEWTRTANAREDSAVVNKTNGSFLDSLAGQYALAATTTYYWRLRYKDQNGNWSGYSYTTSFTTGELPFLPYTLLYTGK
jgi:hypothetical protein